MMKRIIQLFTTLILLIASTLSLQADGNYDLIPTHSISLKSQHYTLIDAENGRILSQKNSEQFIHPASITKVLTTLTAIDALKDTDLESPFEIPYEAVTGFDPIASIAGFQAGEVVTIRDLLYGIMLPSGADATRAVSMLITDTPEGLVTLMNQKAQELGLENTHFVNTSGLDDPDHLSTTNDLTRLVKAALTNPVFKELYTTLRYTTTSTPNNPNGITLHNDTLSQAHEYGFDFIIGTKSGTTDLAERALSSYALVDNHPFILVSTNAPFEEELYTQVKDHAKILNEVNEHYEKKVFVSAGTTLSTIPLKFGTKDIDITVHSDLYSFIEKNYTSNDLTFEFIPVETQFSAPLEKGTLLGNYKAQYKGKELLNEPVYLSEAIPISRFKLLLNFMKVILQVALIAVVLLVVGFLIYLQFRDRRRYQYVKRKQQRRSKTK